MSKQYYFYEDDAEECYQRKHIIDMMREDGITEKEVFKAITEKVEGYFWCRESSDIGESGQCGKICEAYTPKNGKTGMCKYQGKLYAPGEEVTIKIKKEDQQ